MPPWRCGWRCFHVSYRSTPMDMIYYTGVTPMLGTIPILSFCLASLYDIRLQIKHGSFWQAEIEGDMYLLMWKETVNWRWLMYRLQTLWYFFSYLCRNVILYQLNVQAQCWMPCNSRNDSINGLKNHVTLRVICVGIIWVSSAKAIFIKYLQSNCFSHLD